MEDGKKKTIIIIILILIMIILGSLGLNGYLLYKINNIIIPESIEIHDTIFRDSILIKEKTEYKYRSYVDTIFSTHFDTINHTDTLIMAIPIDHYNYKDTLKSDSLDIRLDVGYHGYKASLDSIKIDYDLHYTIPLKRTPKLGYGISIGPSIGYGISIHNNQIIASPQIGVSVLFGLLYNMRK